MATGVQQRAATNAEQSAEGPKPTLDAFPNPFNPSSAIRYRLPVAANVELAVYNSLGEIAAVLAEGPQVAGDHIVQFDGSNLASGTYFCRLIALGNSETKKIVLVR
jgi:hypothetical protein